VQREQRSGSSAASHPVESEPSVSHLRIVSSLLAASLASVAYAHTAEACLSAQDAKAFIAEEVQNGGTLAATLGSPPEQIHPVTGGFLQRFPNGEFWFDACHAGGYGGATYGAIDQKYIGLDTVLGLLKFPLTSELETVSGDGRVNYFAADRTDGGADGAIYWSQFSGAFSMHGIIFQQFGDYGETSAGLGYPTSDEQACTQVHCGPGARENKMQNGFMEFASLSGNPQVANASWALFNQFEQARNLSVTNIGTTGDVANLFITSSSWPGAANAQVRISVLLPGGRFVQTTLTAVNHTFSLRLNLLNTDGIGEVGGNGNGILTTIEATTMINGQPAHTELSSVNVR
jgi:hypothetical protein